MIFLFLMLLVVGNVFTQPESEQSDSSSQLAVVLKQLESVPIVHEGRFKPFISYAQDTLLVLSGHRSYGGKSAMEWIAQMVFTPNQVLDEPLILVEHPDFFVDLGIGRDYHRGRYPARLFIEHWMYLEKRVQAIRKIEADRRTYVEKEIVSVYHRMNIFLEISYSLQCLAPFGQFLVPEEYVQKWIQHAETWVCYFDVKQHEDELKQYFTMHPDDEYLAQVLETLLLWEDRYNKGSFTVIHYRGEWLTPWEMCLDKEFALEDFNWVEVWKTIFLAYHSKQQDSFDQALSHWKYLLTKDDPLRPWETFLLQLETWYCHYPLEMMAFFMYLLVFIGFLILRSGARFIPLRGIQFLVTRGAFVGWFMHFMALVIRILILQRPPVSTLYETFVFVSCVGGGFGWFLALKKKSWNLFFISLLNNLIILWIASQFRMMGSTLGVIEAVLNNYFWLSTHVIAVTCGYAGCFLAGVMAHVMIVQHWWSGEAFTRKNLKTLLLTVSFGWLLISMGTLLGGVWADQSWGRFWGWDPKENGALVIILVNAAVVHMYLGGVLKPKWFPMSCILILLSVLWAWFGTNLLGIGLHSYGFISGIAQQLIVYLVWKGFLSYFLLFIQVANIMAKLSSRLKKQLDECPALPGVYSFLNAQQELLYVGKAKNLKKRVSSYFRGHQHTTKIKVMRSHIVHIQWEICTNESEALLRENQLIKQSHPRYNTLLRDDKMYPYIKITVKDEYPRIEKTRLLQNDQALYFGPYPYAGYVDTLVEYIIRTFKIRDCHDEITYGPITRSCISEQMGLCDAPCQNKITPQEYRVRILEVCAFLDEERQEVIKDIRAQMQHYSQCQRYEEAARMRDVLDAIQLVWKTGKKMNSIQSYPMIVQRLSDKVGCQVPVNRIDCFDISHFQGDCPVASRISFYQGVPDKTLYRKIKMDPDIGIHDPQMIYDAVYRSYRTHKDSLPDAILIDGGIAQLRFGAEACQKLGIEVFLMSLEKRFELVRTLDSEQPINLGIYSDECRLLCFIRDEAHRFALSYHRWRRRKKFLGIQFTDIPTIGSKTAEKMQAIWGDVGGMCQKSLETIENTPFFTSQQQQAIKQFWYEYRRKQVL